MPPRKFILNLAPSDLKKVGTRFDLPMAVALLMVIYHDAMVGKIEREKSLFFGELGLDGSVKPVTGLLPCVLSAIQAGYRTFYVPEDNVYELEYVPDITIYPLTHFGQVYDFLLEGKPIPVHLSRRGIQDVIEAQQSLFDVDFGHIK